MAELDLAVEVAAEGFLAPCRDQRDAEQILEKAAIGLVILDHIGVVMEAQRQFGQKLRLARGCSLAHLLDRVHPAISSRSARGTRIDARRRGLQAQPEDMCLRVQPQDNALW